MFEFLIRILRHFAAFIMMTLTFAYTEAMPISIQITIIFWICVYLLTLFQDLRLLIKAQKKKLQKNQNMRKFVAPENVILECLWAYPGLFKTKADVLRRLFFTCVLILKTTTGNGLRTTQLNVKVLTIFERKYGKHVNFQGLKFRTPFQSTNRTQLSLIQTKKIMIKTCLWLLQA